MERDYEWTIISVLVSNWLHDTRVLDPTELADEIGPVTYDAVLDGDIPVRILIRKTCCEPARIEWHAWPIELGRRTWGTMSILRLSATRAILLCGTYDRARRRSERLREIPLPDAKWGLSSSHCDRLGIETTY
jgi:hypothetical protein